MNVGVIGGGVFGVTAAIALRQRGHDVTLVDPGPLPHPDAASTDLSKLVRMDYGRDALYAEMMEAGIRGWESWNARWPRPLYHGDGMLVLAPELSEGSFEGDSWRTLTERGHPLRRLDAAQLRHDHPAWRGWPDGYRNPRAGWAESGAVVDQLVREALALGVGHVRARVVAVEEASRVRVTEGSGAGGALRFDRVVLAIGAWVGALLPELADRIRTIGQPVLHFRPRDPDAWRPPRFLPWAADIGRTGWYGFPIHPDGVVKVANHGPGIPVDPTGPRVVPEAWEERFRAFFRDHLPGLADAPVVGRRLCLYADSFDGDFWIDDHPDRPGVVVAGGGSGHGFKFAPVLGDLVADVVEARDHRWRRRFAWRAAGARRTEQARHDPG